jgi:hypothetical protein
MVWCGAVRLQAWGSDTTIVHVWKSQATLGQVVQAGAWC